MSFNFQYFDLKTLKGTDIHLGVNNEGITIYDNGKKLTPRISFIWNEIATISYKGTKL